MSKLLLRVATVIAVLIPAVAHAELPNGATITFDMLKIREDGGELKQPSTPDVLRRYLNAAHCNCGRQGLGKEQTVSYLVKSTADTNTNVPVEFWVGTSCADALQRPTMCRKLDQSISDIDRIAIMPETVEFNVYDVFSGFNNATSDIACPVRNGGTAAIFALVDSNGDGTYDYDTTQSLGVTSDVTAFDTQPPPLPTEIEGASAEGSVVLSWTAPTSNATDVYAYQALCANADGTPAFTKAPVTPLYQTVRELCGASQDVALVDGELTGGDEVDPDEEPAPPPITIPQGMKDLEPAFLCGEDTSSTATQLQIKGLTNGKKYVVALLAIDRYGNVAGTSFLKTITPKPATDLWEDLHDRGSTVEGGFCVASVAGARDGLGAGIIALAIALVVVRRRRARGAGGVMIVPVLAAVLLAPHAARAQSIAPYWEEAPQDDDTSVIEGAVTWNVGIRLGPYTPQIDKQFGEEKGPYGEMFGGYKILPMLDIDRIVWRGFGQLGLGGTIGYMQNSAHAWADGSTPGTSNRPRSEGDENVFRLLPLALTATYRFTVLDDLYGIPVVPYIRGGLAYYVWWLRTNDATAETCKDGSSTAMCDSTKALGGTLGLVGSIGLAVRAERVDSNAAISMRQSGIEHAGFYAELSLAKVDGFGSDTKLSVGDATWFAGVNFEF